MDIQEILASTDMIERENTTSIRENPLLGLRFLRFMVINVKRLGGKNTKSRRGLQQKNSARTDSNATKVNIHRQKNGAVLTTAPFGKKKLFRRD